MATQALLQWQATMGLTLPCLPDTQQEAQRLLSKLEPDDDMEVFLCVFEQNAFREYWAKDDWRSPEGLYLLSSPGGK